MLHATGCGARLSGGERAGRTACRAGVSQLGRGAGADLGGGKRAARGRGKKGAGPRASRAERGRKRSGPAGWVAGLPGGFGLGSSFLLFYF